MSNTWNEQFTPIAVKAKIEIGDLLPNVEESPFLINALWKVAREKFPLTTQLEITRHGELLVRLGEQDKQEIEEK